MNNVICGTWTVSPSKVWQARIVFLSHPHLSQLRSSGPHQLLYLFCRTAAGPMHCLGIVRTWWLMMNCGIASDLASSVVFHSPSEFPMNVISTAVSMCGALIRRLSCSYSRRCSDLSVWSSPDILLYEPGVGALFRWCYFLMTFWAALMYWLMYSAGLLLCCAEAG